MESSAGERCSGLLNNTGIIIENALKEKIFIYDSSISLILISLQKNNN